MYAFSIKWQKFYLEIITEVQSDQVLAASRGGKYLIWLTFLRISFAFTFENRKLKLDGMALQTLKHGKSYKLNLNENSR